jgi:C-terminal processing protease CtpA/Prc
MIRFSAVPMYDQNGTEIEFGVNPDIQVNTTEEDVTTGKDTMIEYAITLLKNS